MSEARPPLPPFTAETAAQKARTAVRHPPVWLY